MNTPVVNTLQRIADLEQKGAFHEAIALLSQIMLPQATEIGPDPNPIYRIKLILLLIKAGNHTDALKHFGELDQAERYRASMLAAASKCHLALGDRQQAASALFHAFKVEPSFYRDLSAFKLLLSYDRFQEAGQVAEGLLNGKDPIENRAEKTLMAANEILGFTPLRGKLIGAEYNQTDYKPPLQQPEAFLLSKQLFEASHQVMLHYPVPENVSGFRDIAAITGMQLQAIDRLKTVTDPGFTALARLSDLYSRTGNPEQAKLIYDQAMGTASTLPATPAISFDSKPPLVFFHRGQADYFQQALVQARRFNPTRRIIVLGDDHNRLDNIEYHPWAKYRGKAARLVNAYRHKSINDFPFELFCLERWAVMLEFCEAFDIEEVIHLDSDVLVFDSFEADLEAMRQKRASLCGIHAAIGYFQRTELVYFYELLCRFFEDPSYLPEIQSQQGYNDMTFLNVAAKSRQWGNLLLPVNGAVCDEHIRSDDGYDFQNGFKQFNFIEGKPYCRHLASNTLHHFRTIHFQGSAKSLMAEFVVRAQASARPETGQVTMR